MNNKNNNFIVLVIFSLLLLVIFFLLFFLGDIFNFGEKGTVDEARKTGKNLDSNKQIIFEPSSTDPLITSVSKLYESMIRENDPVRGNDGADFVILEFGDFECPYCRDLSTRLSRVVAEFAPQIKLVWKDFPNPIHLQARPAALAARCAQEQGKFWEYHDYLFANQDNLSRDLYNKIALELNLNLADFNRCLDGNNKIEAVGQGLTDGQKLGVDATPYLFIGNKVIDYAITEKELREIIKKELGR